MPPSPAEKCSQSRGLLRFHRGSVVYMHQEKIMTLNTEMHGGSTHTPPYHQWMEQRIEGVPVENLWGGLLAVEGLWLLPPEQQSALQEQILIRLKTVLGGAGDLCFRMQHYDFLFVVNQADLSRDDVGRLAEAIAECFHEPFVLDGLVHHILPHIGMASANFEPFTMREWITHTQWAMQQAREKHSTHHVFSVEDKNLKSEQHRLQSDLKQAIQHNAFELHYQPKVDLQSGVCVGAEALARWERPHYGSVPPSVFIPALESSHLIVAFGKSMLNTLSEQLQLWRNSNVPMVRVSFNVSAVQFNNDEAGLSSFERLLRETVTNNPDILLDVELTEGTLMNDLKRSMDIIHNMKALGATCSIDDFGKGFSSLSYLKTLPVDCLKIDKMFVDDLCESPQTEAIVSAIIFMAHQLNLVVVAEGVETEQQYEKLRKMGCDQAQGFYIAKPMSAPDFSAWLDVHFQKHREVGYEDSDMSNIASLLRKRS